MYRKIFVKIPLKRTNLSSNEQRYHHTLDIPGGETRQIARQNFNETFMSREKSPPMPYVTLGEAATELLNHLLIH